MISSPSFCLLLSFSLIPFLFPFAPFLSVTFFHSISFSLSSSHFLCLPLSSSLFLSLPLSSLPFLPSFHLSCLSLTFYPALFSHLFSFSLFLPLIIFFFRSPPPSYSPFTFLDTLLLLSCTLFFLLIPALCHLRCTISTRTGPKERVAGPRGMDPLGPVSEYLILHHFWSRAVS